jgi:DNA replication and repair protein RecF
MYIERLKLTSFRNIMEAELEFSPGKNLICGLNGAGKTNILEALFYIGAARSFRTHLDENMVNSNSDFFRLEARGQIPPHDVLIEIAVKPGTRKTIKANSAPLKKLGELFEYFRLVEFSPYDINIIIGAPSLRRKFLSITIAQSEPRHIAVLSEYYKTLAQRNALLKTYQGRDRLLPDQEATLLVWDEKLAQHAVAIHTSRCHFIEKISLLATDYYQKISASKEQLTLRYSPSPKIEEYDPVALCAKWSSRRRRELAMGQTLYGPHRDDLAFSIDGLEAKSGASQGQIKTAVLSLKLAQYEYLKERLNQTPIVLLDEIFSDLDSARLDFIIELLPQLGQTFIATSKPSEIKDLTIFNSKYILEQGFPKYLK